MFFVCEALPTRKLMAYTRERIPEAIQSQIVAEKQWDIPTGIGMGT